MLKRFQLLSAQRLSPGTLITFTPQASLVGQQKLLLGELSVSQYDPKGQQDRTPHRSVPEGQTSSTRAQPWIVSRAIRVDEVSDKKEMNDKVEKNHMMEVEAKCNGSVN